MGNLVAEACLEHAQALRHANGPVRIGQAHHAATALAQQANTARQKNKADRASVKQQEIIADRKEICPLRRGTDGPRSNHPSSPFRLFGKLDDRPSLLIVAEQRERWEKNRAGEQEWRQPPEERLQAQPETKADAAVNPDNDQEYGLAHAEIRPCDPESVQDLPIAFL